MTTPGQTPPPSLLWRYIIIVRPLKVTIKAEIGGPGVMGLVLDYRSGGFGQNKKKGIYEPKFFIDLDLKGSSLEHSKTPLSRSKTFRTTLSSQQKFFIDPYFRPTLSKK